MDFWNKLKRGLEKAVTYASYVASFGLAYLNDKETQRIREYVLENTLVGGNFNHFPSNVYASYFSSYPTPTVIDRYARYDSGGLTIFYRTMGLKDLLGLISFGDLDELDSFITGLQKPGGELFLKSIKIGNRSEPYKRFAYEQIYRTLLNRYEGLKYWSKREPGENYGDLMNRLYNVIEDFYWNYLWPSYK
ncbi:MAG: hypothetical protein QXQ18_01905 [Candidatus Aenigmatarchaeota archaeon]